MYNYDTISVEHMRLLLDDLFNIQMKYAGRDTVPLQEVLQDVRGRLKDTIETPYNDDGFCSKCGTELDTTEDENWDVDENGHSSMATLKHLWCPKCEIHIDN